MAHAPTGAAETLAMRRGGRHGCAAVSVAPRQGTAVRMAKVIWVMRHANTQGGA